MKFCFIRMAAAVLAAIQFLTFDVGAVSARKAILMDAQTGRVIYEKNADSKSLIASTTKIMTALIVCEQCNVLDRVRIPKEAEGIEGSSMYLVEGEVLTVQDLLYGLMLHSGNDAAVALALYCGGTLEGFSELMNDKARLLGLENSHFENPHGLDSPGHYSTARDLAVLSCYAMKNPVFVKTVSAKQVTIGSRILRNHNKLLWLLDGADGIKTGYTKAAGRILVSSAVRQGRRLVAVTIDAPDDWHDHKSLIGRGFADYKIRRIIQSDSYIGSVDVIGGDRSEVSVVTSEDFFYSIAENETASVVIAGPQFAYAPISSGQSAGFAYILLDGAVIGKVPIEYSDSISLEDKEEHSLLKRLLGG
jgi:D-alanyl-D-alanine carboxypeptidase